MGEKAISGLPLAGKNLKSSKLKQFLGCFQAI